MLRWSLVFLIVALVAALLGFTGVAGQSLYFARILFYIFIVVFLVSMLYGLIMGKRPAGT